MDCDVKPYNVNFREGKKTLGKKGKKGKKRKKRKKKEEKEYRDNNLTPDEVLDPRSMFVPDLLPKMKQRVLSPGSLLFVLLARHSILLHSSGTL